MHPPVGVAYGIGYSGPIVMLVNRLVYLTSHVVLSRHKVFLRVFNIIVTCGIFVGDEAFRRLPYLVTRKLYDTLHLYGRQIIASRIGDTCCRYK